MAKMNYLIKVRRSRKAYLGIYFMILVIIATLVYIHSVYGYINTITLIISAIFIVLLLKLTELHRLKDWWAVTDSSFIQSTGLLNKNVRDIDFHSISDLDLDQHLFKRFLNFGDVNIRLFLNETSISIKNINNPSKFIRDLQEIISNSRREHHGIKKR